MSLLLLIKNCSNLIISRREMSVIKKYSILRQLALTLDCCVPRLSIFVAVLSYVLFGNYINAEKVYLVTAYYNVLRNSLIFGFSMGKIIIDANFKI